MTYSDKLKHPKWQKKRLKILDRDGWTCQECGAKDITLHVHHISYFENPWDVDDRLLITLCEDCHKEEEVYLKEGIPVCIRTLKNCGFTSLAFAGLKKIFQKDRGWDKYEPAFDILKMVVEDDSLWNAAEEEFWKRLSEKQKINSL